MKKQKVSAMTATEAQQGVINFYFEIVGAKIAEAVLHGELSTVVELPAMRDSLFDLLKSAFEDSGYTVTSEDLDYKTDKVKISWGD